MGIDLGKNYYFVDTLFEDIDQLDNFVDHRIWKLELEDKEEEMQKFSEMSVGDYIVAKTSYTRKKELPFENPNNNTVSVMRIMAVGLIEKILNDEHSLSVNWIKNYQQENKEWYFYTSKELIWQPNVHKSDRKSVV